MSSEIPDTAARPAGRWARLSVQNWVHLVLGAFVLVVCGCVVAGGLVLARISDRTTELVDRIQPARAASFELQSALLNQETGVRGFALTGDVSFLEPFAAGKKEEKERLARVRSAVGDDQPYARDLDRIAAAASEWRRVHADPLIAQVRKDGPGARSSARVTGSKTAFDELRRLYGTQQAHLDSARDRVRGQLDDARHTRDRVLVALLVVFALCVVSLSVLLQRTVGRPLNALAEASRRVRSGRYRRQRIEVRGPSDVRAVAAAVEDMRSRLVAELDAAQEREDVLAQQTVELRRSNSELEQFAYVASHDLQEPLRKVASFCQLLDKRYGNELDGRGKQYIDFAVDGAKRMQVLINDLLTFSRVGRVHDGWTPVDLDGALDRALANLALVLEESGTAVVRETPLPEITGDPTTLAMVWQNLIGNAVKFRRPGEPSVITVGCERDGDDWHFTVADNGIGIAPEFAEKVFVIFQRLHGRDEYDGTGIGLALCRKIVEFHGGRIWLDPESRRGARVHFSLPADPAPAETTADDAPPTETSGDAT
ncbi:sensor histidine kinase [Streptomyces sp. NBC_00525]|uniref:sensor histidine kinase n=1 Tax=Streptomyces sp. NBC_00525 TaxID=2903660 RepID=UPI002E814B71|nr:CHASE3 domain-containing protein [Streptomyces sp. NBC_00525]WUC97201.1 CHASE3 domain-containing protein [Streptomyces sp. NBC_00525]